jgi:phosphonate transport system permease protein
MRFGILPQVLSVLLSHILYFFESNIPSATILGVVGAGGIGLQLADAFASITGTRLAFS